MGLVNWSNKDKTNKTNKNIGNITSDVATDIIKKLSGGNVSYSKKIIDNVVCITNASGGTGASTLVANIAYTVSKMDLRVLVIDLNIMYPVQHLYFGIKQDIEKPDFVGYLLGKNNLGKAIEHTGVASVMYSNNRGLMDFIDCESEQAIDNFNETISTLRGLYDLIIIDCPMKIDSYLCNNALYACDQIYVVWDEGISSISNTEKIRRNMANTGIDAYNKVKVILNKRTNIHYSEYPFKKLNIELIQTLPFESDIIVSSLKSEIFCDKGASTSQNAKYFCGGIENLSNKILQLGGYIR